MALLREKELFCISCGKIEKYPVCCGKEMEADGEMFFCLTCGKERPLKSCCSLKMSSRTVARNLKEEVFKEAGIKKES